MDELEPKFDDLEEDDPEGAAEGGKQIEGYIMGLLRFLVETGLDLDDLKAVLTSNPLLVMADHPVGIEMKMAK